MRRVVVVLVVSVVAGLVSAASPGGPPSCGATLTGHVRLTTDLTCATDVGLRLAGGATLDLGGHTIRRTAPQVGSVGLLRVDDAPVEVRNGHVSGWSSGVQGAGDATQVTPRIAVDRVVFSGNDIAVNAYGAQFEITASVFRRNGTAVDSWKGDVRMSDVVVDANRVGVTATFGSAVVSRAVFSRNAFAAGCSEGSLQIDHAKFVGNGTGVFNSWCGADVTASRFVGNTTAFSADYMSGFPSVRGSVFLHNGTAVDLAFGGIVEDNDFRHNGTGIVWDYPDIYPDWYELRITGNRLSHNGDAVVVPIGVAVGANVVVHNTGWGINTPEAVDLGGNVAYGNGREPQCVGVVCAAG